MGHGRRRWLLSWWSESLLLGPWGSCIALQLAGRRSLSFFFICDMDAILQPRAGSLMSTVHSSGPSDESHLKMDHIDYHLSYKLFVRPLHDPTFSVTSIYNMFTKMSIRLRFSSLEQWVCHICMAKGLFGRKHYMFYYYKAFKEFQLLFFQVKSNRSLQFYMTIPSFEMPLNYIESFSSKKGIWSFMKTPRAFFLAILNKERSWQKCLLPKLKVALHA